jgi:NTP pyrophosphatase (non-canonical NTP hydrolase)
VISPLCLDEYQKQAIRTDQTKKRGSAIDLTILGLVGEVGSLLSEVKKKQRDARSYLGYEDAVVEEMGDMLWYLAAVASHHNLDLSNIATPPDGSRHALTFADLQPQRDLPLASPSIAFERTLLRLAGAVGRLADTSSTGFEDNRSGLQALLAKFWVLCCNRRASAGSLWSRQRRRTYRKRLIAGRWNEKLRRFST